MKKLISVSCRFVLLSLLVLPFSLMTFASITVKDYGVRPLNPGDVAMIFYATVSNRNSDSQRVRLHMSKCCLVLPDYSEDCETMKLLGGLEGNLRPKASFNLTMYYVAENLYNRKGSCSFRILSREKKALFRRLKKREESPEIIVPFNTSLPKATILDQIHFQLGGSKDGYTLCNTPHLDPERNCQEDNCLMRFSGHRSFFHKESQLCQSTSDCTSDDNEIISPITGKCKEMSTVDQIIALPEIKNASLDIELLEGLTNSENIDKSVSSSSSSNAEQHVLSLTSTMPRMKCVNGNKTHFGCICYQGWSSVDLNSSTHSNASAIEEFSLCNILTEEGKLLERARLHRDNVIVLSIMVGTLCIVGAIGIIWLLYNRVGRRGYNILKESRDSEDTIPEDVIHEIAHRRESTFGPKYSHANNTSSNLNQREFSRETSKHGSSTETSNPQERSLSSSFPNPSKVSHSTDSTGSFITSTRAATDISERGDSTSALHSSDSYPDYEGLFLTPSETNSSETDIDTLISLSHNEKLRTKSEPLLFPLKVKEVNPRKTQSSHESSQITTEDLINNNIIVEPESESSAPASSQPSVAASEASESKSTLGDVHNSSSGQLSRVQSSKLFELNTSQKEEEWDKFLKFFTTCKLSRRRSLCSTPEEQVQEALRHIRDGIRAHKTFSMPALRSTNPFINFPTTDEEMSTTKSIKSSIESSTTSDSSSGNVGVVGSSCTSIWSSLSSSSDCDFMSSSTSRESSDDYRSISPYPKKIQTTDHNSNKVPGKLAANFNFSKTQQQPHLSTSKSNTNIQLVESIGSLRYGSSDTDPYAITAKLKEALRASKSRSVDSLIKNTQEQRK